MVTLEEIIGSKKKEVEQRKQELPESRLRELMGKVAPPRDFRNALKKKGEVSIIGEVKRASPSAGVIRSSFNVKEIASELAEGGAAAVSVITEKKYFYGDLLNLITVYNTVGLPVLRKDFIVDKYQVLESRAFCADAVLLIAAVLDAARFRDLYELARETGMEVLAEVHGEDELEKVLDAGAGIIGVNNRNLKDFTVDTNRIFKLRKLIPEDRVVVCESGVKTNDQVKKLAEKGIHAALVGETLMRSSSITGKLRELLR